MPHTGNPLSTAHRNPLPDNSADRISLTDCGMDVVQLQIQVQRSDIAFLCNLVGSYEGLGIIRTLDAAQGVVEMMIAPAFYETALDLLEHLSQGEIPLRILTRPAIGPG